MCRNVALSDSLHFQGHCRRPFAVRGADNNPIDFTYFDSRVLNDRPSTRSSDVSLYMGIVIGSTRSTTPTGSIRSSVAPTSLASAAFTMLIPESALSHGEVGKANVGYLPVDAFIGTIY